MQQTGKSRRERYLIKMKKGLKVAVVGATGMVGQVMRKVLHERHFPVDRFIPVASEKSLGRSISWGKDMQEVVSLEHALEQKPDIALFSAGGSVSKQWAPRFAEKGCFVIDNSSAWRMDAQIPLIVPEVNGHVLKPHDRIIANPNCSTIQLMMVLKPLSDRYGLERVLVSTYQSVTGTGQKAARQLEEEREGNGSGERVYPHAIDLNIIPHCDVFVDSNYTREEMKLLLESRKILALPELRLSATAVRIPVRGGHSESVNVELKEQPRIPEVRELLAAFPGLIVQDEPEKNIYPMPAFAEGRDEVFVGRIRQDLSHPRALNLFVVADNLRKGAATNAVQIAEMVRMMHFS